MPLAKRNGICKNVFSALLRHNLNYNDTLKEICNAKRYTSTQEVYSF